MALPITVSGPRTDGSERNVGKNTIVIAMTRSDAGFPRDVLRHYVAASTPKCNSSQRWAKPERRRSLHQEA